MKQKTRIVEVRGNRIIRTQYRGTHAYSGQCVVLTSNDSFELAKIRPVLTKPTYKGAIQQMLKIILYKSQPFGA